MLQNTSHNVLTSGNILQEGRAPGDYQNLERFFERTYLTKNLASFVTEVIWRLSGKRTGTRAVFNLSSQFGSGKTHALTLLYHLAKHGPAANNWAGVGTLLAKAGVAGIPKANVAVFVGNGFDSILGHGGKGGTPNCKTPWGEIAFQLGGKQAFAMVAGHDKKGEAPGSEVIRKFIPKDKPALILMDELMIYVSSNRKSGLGAQLYIFLQNLSEVADSMDNIVLAVSIQGSELQMTPDDLSEFERFKNLLDGLGKSVVMSSDAEISEIIRHQLTAELSGGSNAAEDAHWW
jgi:predicted AAA+ superfamily ATPase